MATIYDDTEEDIYWQNADPDELWIYDKLILSRKLGYTCGPAGIDVPKPNFYIVKPCVNVLGLGLGAKKVTLEKYTMHLPHGSFWCEWFEGRHLSVDYRYGEQWVCVEGFKKKNTLIKWDKWVKTDDVVPLPKVLEQFKNKPIINCEFIGGKLIEAHFRSNPDFPDNRKEFIPVWEGQDKNPPEGYQYIDYPDVHGRIGAFIKY
jgi:hypothetical protein